MSRDRISDRNEPTIPSWNVLIREKDPKRAHDLHMSRAGANLVLNVCLGLQNAVMFSHLRGFWEFSLQQREQYHCHSWLPKNPQPLRHRMSVRGIIDILAWPEDTSLMSVCSPDPCRVAVCQNFLSPPRLLFC